MCRFVSWCLSRVVVTFSVCDIDKLDSIVYYKLAYSYVWV